MRPLPPAAAQTLAVVVAGLSSVGAVGATAGAEEPPASAAQPQPQRCFWSAEAQPDAPLELDLVASGRLAKTIAMQKEIFACFQGVNAEVRQAGAIDVETFVELVQRAGPRGVDTVARRVRVAACRKQIAGLARPPIRIACETRAVKLRRLPTPFPGCAFTGLPRDPVVMDSARLRFRNNRFVKTVKLEKEIFLCTGRILDVFVFTEVVERRKKNDLVPVATTFDAIACTKARTTSGAPAPFPAVRCARVPT
jgi:hypothetical protein